MGKIRQEQHARRRAWYQRRHHSALAQLAAARVVEAVQHAREDRILFGSSTNARQEAAWRAPL